VIVLVSGGGSALLSLPAPGLDLEDLRQTTAALLQAGIPIEEMNVVRKHLSAISGGRLAAASAAPVLALIISDVTGDDPADIASGPCAADPSSFADALAIVTGHGLQLPPAVRQHLRSGAAGAIADTPKPGDPRLARVENRVIGSAQRSLEAAAAVFTQAGIAVVSLGDRITGEAREVGRVMAGIALEAARPQSAWPRPVALISGGECTVSVGAAGGRGGRNTEFLLSLAIALKGAAGIHALAADTDGIDGTEDNAGALAGPDTLERAARAGLSAKAMLARHEAYGFFAALGDLLVTGPTLTNVNDYRAILVGVRS
jgi:hydroxypyruvate reductase